MSERYEELDSLRGIASLTVVFHHCLLTLPVFFIGYYHEQVNSIFAKILTNSPLHVIWSGHEAVILFFVLSGFVLSLSFLKENVFKYSTYIVKRFCRIYIPYIISVILSGILFKLLKDNDPNYLSEWFNGMWSKPITIKTFFDYILMLGLDTHNLNTVTWSLVHEMRISLFFPFLMIPIIKFNWKKSLPLCIFMTFSLWVILLNVSLLIRDENLSNIIYSFANTFYYSSFFIIGAIFAKYKGVIKALYKNTNKSLKFSLLLLCFLLYLSEWILPGIGRLKYHFSIFHIYIFNAITDLLIVLGVSILFTFSLNSPGFKKALTKKIPIFLGKISYSIYLIHPIVLLSFIYIGKDLLPISVILMSVPIISVVFAILYHKLIELPSIRLGRKIKRLPVKSIKKIA